MTHSVPDSPQDALQDAVQDSPFLRACRRQPVPYTPVWFMRQAGRSLPEYRAARAGVGMLEACLRPDLVAELTLQPVRRYGVDAAILFSDIVVPLRAAGVDLDIEPGVGPVIAAPVRDARAVRSVGPLADDAVEPVAAAVRLLVAELGATPLIGFAGAPFTLASYLVEGGPSRNHERTKALMYGDPLLWHELLDRLAAVAATFLSMQVRAGVAAVQLFDSWVGALSEADYRAHVLPHSAAVLSTVAATAAEVGRPVPRIHFGVGTGELLGAMREAGADVVGVDFRVPLGVAAGRTGPGVALQGNLDPAALLAPRTALEEQVAAVLRSAVGLPGHVFNLGHGVLPQTDPGALAHVVDLVHGAGQDPGGQDSAAPDGAPAVAAS